MKKPLICSLTAIILIASSCQSNPETDIVTNKKDGIIMNTSESETSETESKNEVLSYSEQFQGSEKGIEVITDLTFSPISTPISIYRCRARDITMEEIKHWANVFFKDQPLYEPTTLRSKTEIETIILNYKARIADREQLLQEYSGNTESVDAYITYIEGLIHSLEEEYSNAPDSVERVATDWQFHNYEYYDINRDLESENNEYDSLNKSHIFRAEAEIDNTIGNITCYNRDEDDYLMHSLSYIYSKETDITEQVPLKYIKQEEAQKISDEIIQQLGFSDWTLMLASANKPSPEDDTMNEQYFFTYVPKYDNLPSFYYPMLSAKSDDSYAAHYYYQYVNVMVQNGIIISVSWYSPVEITDTVEDNVQILPIAEIYQKMKDFISMKYTISTLEGNTGITSGSIEILVDHAELQMCRIKEKNSQNFLIVPVWAFTGTISIDGFPMYEETNLAVINAVDGSIINAELGY